MFSKELEEVIDAALADGVLTDKERAVLHKRAIAEGVDPDELDVIIEGRLAKIKKSEDWLRPAPPQHLATEKLGNVLKCPSCGAQVVGGSAICPECGYTFSNVQANSSSERLLEKLEEYNRRQEAKPIANNSVLGSIIQTPERIMAMNNAYKYKLDIVSSFPVPNTRADLLEFLTMIQAKAKSTGSKSGRSVDGQEDLSYGYWLLYSNCINKAKISFSSDPDFAPYFEHYAAEQERTKGFIGWLKCSSPQTRALIGLGIMFLLCILLSVVIALCE